MKLKIINLTILALTVCSSYQSYTMEFEPKDNDHIKLEQEIEEQKIILKSNDGQEFEISKEIAVKSDTLKSALDNIKKYYIPNIFTIPISYDALCIIVDYMKVFAERKFKSEFINNFGFKNTEILSQALIGADFLLLEQKDLIRFLAIQIKGNIDKDNKLNIQALLDITNNTLIPWLMWKLDKRLRSKDNIEDYINNLNIPVETKILLAKYYFCKNIIPNIFMSELNKYPAKQTDDTDKYCLPLNIKEAYGVSIQDLIDADIFKTYYNRIYQNPLGINRLNLSNLHINSLKGLSNLPQISEITHLNLDFNKITYIDPEDIKYLTNLEDLRLSNNQITFIEKSVFDNLPKLRALGTTNNLFTKIDEDQVLKYFYGEI